MSKIKQKDRKITEWHGKLEDAPKYPDIEYWRSVSDEELFKEVWNMIVFAHKIKGEDISESRLNRSIETFERRRR